MMRAWTTGLAGIVVAGLLLLTVGACATEAGGTGGSGGGAARRPSASEMPVLPTDPHDAMLAVRRLLVEQIAPLLADSGQRCSEVRYLLTTADADETAYQGHLFVTVAPTDWGADEVDTRAMAAAARARGWTDGGISHRLNLVRGPYRLTSTPRPDGSQRYEVATPPLRPATRIEGTDDVTSRRVPELDDYRSSG